MTDDPRYVVPVEGEPFGDELDKLIDAALSASIPQTAIAAALRDRADREDARADL